MSNLRIAIPSKFEVKINAVPVYMVFANLTLTGVCLTVELTFS